MKKLSFTITVCFIMFVSCQKKQATKLNIAVAANMQFAMKVLAKTFTKKTNILCNLIISSSGKLTAQIKAGAPYNVFISANMKYPNDLFKSGFATKAPVIYAYGKLVMWSMVEGIHPSIALLNNKQIKHIALANPKMAPYGIATIAVLKHYHLYNSLKTKLVFGENISQTNQFIISKSSAIGFTSKSVVLSPQMKGKGNWIAVDESVYTPIAQGVVVLKHHRTELKNSKKFYDFLLSAEAKKILKNFGYSVK